MRFVSWLKVLLVSLMLSGCVAPLLAGAQSQLLWALIKPMVGLDPNEVNLFEQPMVKDRLQPLLGEHYGTAVQLLKTADEVQQEGPLFYVLSKNDATKPLADKAGFVWNSTTNQMAVMLQQNGQSQVFSEPATSASSTATTPVWPQAMQSMLTSGTSPLQNQMTNMLGSAANAQLNSTVGNQMQQADQLKSSVTQTAPAAETGAAEQVEQVMQTAPAQQAKAEQQVSTTQQSVQAAQPALDAQAKQAVSAAEGTQTLEQVSAASSTLF